MDLPSASRRSWNRRSSDPGRGRCATSWPPSSPSRTASSGRRCRSRSASRVRRARARPRSACTAPRTCSTPTASNCPDRACWSSGPTKASCPTSATCCPPSGEIDATQATVSSLVTAGTGAEIRGLDTVPAALIKGDARMAEVLRRAVWSHVGRPEGTLVVPRGAYQWRVGSYLVTEIVEELRTRGVRYAAGRAMLPQRLAHQVLLRMEASGDSPDDRVQNAVARSRPVRAYADALWPALDPAKLVLRLLTDRGVPGGAGRRGAGRRGAEPDHDGQAGPIRPYGSLVAGRRDLDRRDRRPALAGRRAWVT